MARGKITFCDSCEGFLASAKILFVEFDNKDAIVKQIKGLKWSDFTIMSRIENIGKGVSDQLCANLSAAVCFSIAVDESTDVTDVAQLCLGEVPPQKISVPNVPNNTKQLT